MAGLTIAAAQIPVTADIDANAAAINRGIDYAVAQKADILLTPEGSLSGYTHEFDQALTDKHLAEITGRAREAGLGLALGTCFREADGQVYNQVRLYDTDGTFLGFHSKILRCGSMCDPDKGEVNNYAVKPLEVFTFKGVTIGLLICNDMWANPMCTPMPDPHLTQKLSAMGAQVILHAVNGGRGDDKWRQVIWNYHESNLRMRAKAGKVWIVTVDNSFPFNFTTASPCGVIDPEGNWAVKAAPKGEQFFTGKIEIK